MLDTGKVTITQGEDATFTIKLRDENGDPFDLSGYDEYKVCLPEEDGDALGVIQTPNANGSVVSLLGAAVLGQLQVTVKAVDTLGLEPDERQHIGLELNNAGTPAPRRKVFENVLTVVSFTC